ncbi:rhamnogalacturonan acetylesterase [Uliginosibacterium sp. sgz301328]|uniref:rhamnogalacturonan acetylesterase n=1 Tax=Uliginosibacterium sp. sgz301328 TaxID=3243764 RepID=UPI00359E8B4C
MNQRILCAAVTAALIPMLSACGSDDDNGSSTSSSSSSISSSASSSSSSSSSTSSAATTLKGVAAADGHALAGASIKVCDAAGTSRAATAGSDGSYTIDVTGLTAPLLVAATSGSVQYAGLLGTVASGSNTANVSPLTDSVASGVAGSMGLAGTVQLIAGCNTAKATASDIATKTGNLRKLISAAITDAGLDASTYDPVTTPMKIENSGTNKILAEVRHNREGFSNSTSDQYGATYLYDRNMMEIRSTNLLDPTLKAWSSYGTRIFVAGDSTASNYNKEVLPRMGWGQVLDRQLKSTTDVKVVNVAQSGRSSRSFITEGWFDLISAEIKSGDYLLVQFGHNDEKCNSGDIDLTFRCTYPNTSAGALPGSSSDLSFQKTLEKYVKLAKDKGATVVLITPVTRINQDKTVTAYVEGAFPITKSTHITSSGAYPGNYSQTVIDTAKANNVAYVDLDAKSIAFMNSIGVGTGGAEATGGWRDYHLAVKDFVTYPYYASVSTTGHYLNADRTHFQENGAVKVSSMIVEGIKENSSTLSGLIALLK